MTECTLERGTPEYQKLEAVAKILEILSPHRAAYVVRDVYLDFGSNWMWTTICREGYRECQILSPRDWKQIMFCETAQDIADAVQDIRNGDYFGDK